jgi:glycosyltransferase involved in cell wall biosynthesis
MTRIAILSRDMTAADAVSNDVLAMQRLLSKRDHDVRVFVDTTNLTIPQISPAGEALTHAASPEDVLLYHHSIGWDGGVEIFKTASCRKIVKYHNVTPAYFFEGISERHQHLCHSGKLQVKDVVECRPDLLLADSAFNKTDLTAAGSDDDKTFVLPPFNQADELQASTADLQIVDSDGDESVNLLAVGGVRPNKGLAALIEAFAIYTLQFNRAARLFLVGAETQALSSYGRIIRQMINTWDIGSRVVFTGTISNESLKAYYLIADALLTTSEHEGFCVPLVEAMAMKVPIVAYASTAIPETAKDAGLILNEREPYWMAQSIDYLLGDETAKMALVARGFDRYEQLFSNHAIEKQFLDMTARAGFHF